MGNTDFLSPKAISNRSKQKGLGKLRWYCQMCEKQCPDQNGFKCHCESDSHLRQMHIFGQNPSLVIGSYAKMFEDSFLKHMKLSHRFSRVAATVVYNEYISDKTHVHMNATVWDTLTDFVKYLGKTGKCKVEDTQTGWFITYIDRDSETLENMKRKRIRDDIVDEEKHEREIKKQINRAEQLISLGLKGDKNLELEEEKSRLFKKSEDDQKVRLSLASPSKPDARKKVEGRRGLFDEDAGEVNNKGNTNDYGEYGLSSLDDSMREEEKENREDNWLCEGVIVKVMSKLLGEEGYYKKKGVICKVIDRYVGEIEMLDSKHVLRVDQKELRTVLPPIGGLVRIVNGVYRGSIAKLLAVDDHNFCAKVQITEGIYEGRGVLDAVEYEDICKLA